jgi:predicted HicB family RNase H-like nuclease
MRPKLAGRGRRGNQLNLRVSKDERAAWAKLAREQGLALSAWIRVACNAAAVQQYRVRFEAGRTQ